MHEVRANIQFDISSMVPENAEVTTATLSIYRDHEPKVNLQYGYDQDGSLYCYASTDAWSSDVTNWEQLYSRIVDAYDTDGGAIVNYSANTIDWIDFDVTEIVARFVSNPSLNKGFHIGATVDEFVVDGQSGVNGGYTSCEYSNASLRPKLTITYEAEGIHTNQTGAFEKSQLKAQLVSENAISISIPENGEYSISLFTLSGKELYSSNSFVAEGTKTIQLTNTLSHQPLIVSVSNAKNKRNNLLIH